MQSRYRALLCGLSVAAVCVITAAGPAFGQGTAAQTPTPASMPEKPFTYEFYYKVKWGHQDEFLALYKKNHLPILRKQQERGEILSISAAFPINHSSEDRRWDFRITVTYRDAIIAHEDPSGAAWVKEMFPDQDKFKREEQTRFALLLEHMDIPITIEDVRKW